MQATSRWGIASIAALAVVLSVRVTLQGTPQNGGQSGAPAPGQGRAITSFPAQQRPPGDPAVVERGKQVYGMSCRSCHGADLRGGDMGGPNLLRSDVMLNDDNGERLLPVVRGARPGMPAIDLADTDITAVAIYIHSVLATARAQGAPPLGEPVTLNILVGDASAGAIYFDAKCQSCHSTADDLKGVGTRFTDPMKLQDAWVGGGRPLVAGEELPPRRMVTATVTTTTGAKVSGRLDRIDDFTVTLVLEDGTRRTIRRAGDTPKVEINDPLAGHKALLQTYTDRDVHNITAYLMTLK